MGIKIVLMLIFGIAGYIGATNPSGGGAALINSTSNSINDAIPVIQKTSQNMMPIAEKLANFSNSRNNIVYTAVNNFLYNPVFYTLSFISVGMICFPYLWVRRGLLNKTNLKNFMRFWSIYYKIASPLLKLIVRICLRV